MKMLMSLLCIAMLSCMVPADTVADDAPDDVIEAVRNSAVVQTEVSRARKRVNAKDSSAEGIKVVGLGGGCGVAGCSARYLAVIKVHRGGVNPQTESVLATVERFTNGRLGKVRVVELKPKEAVETKLEVQKRYSSPRPAIEKN